MCEGHSPLAEEPEITGQPCSTGDLKNVVLDEQHARPECTSKTETPRALRSKMDGTWSGLRTPPIRPSEPAEPPTLFSGYTGRRMRRCSRRCTRRMLGKKLTAHPSSSHVVALNTRWRDRRAVRRGHGKLRQAREFFGFEVPVAQGVDDSLLNRGPIRQPLHVARPPSFRTTSRASRSGPWWPLHS